jgi:hypothetical protein
MGKKRQLLCLAVAVAAAAVLLTGKVGLSVSDPYSICQLPHEDLSRPFLIPAFGVFCSPPA